MGLLIPRPHSFLMNCLLFGVGIGFAWLEGYRGVIDLEMPVWLFVLLWFVVQEILVQQAKYMWNDIRDHDQDQLNPANQRRPLAKRPITHWTKIIMLGRWGLGIVLAAMLSPVLLVVVLAISGLQILYELYGKPEAWKWPKLPLLIVSAGIVLKTTSGALALGVPSGEQRMWLYGIALFATGVIFVSSFWRIEADFFLKKKLPMPRGQSIYFAEKGMKWLRAGTAVALAICILLFLDGYYHFLEQGEISTITFLCISIGGGLTGSVSSYWLLGREKTAAAVVVIFIGALVYALFSIDILLPIPRESAAAILLLILLLLDSRLNARIDFEQQNLLYLAENWPKFNHIVREQANRKNWWFSWRYLMQLALTLNSPNFEELREKQGQSSISLGQY